MRNMRIKRLAQDHTTSDRQYVSPNLTNFKVYTLYYIVPCKTSKGSFILYFAKDN